MAKRNTQNGPFQTRRSRITTTKKKNPLITSRRISAYGKNFDSKMEYEFYTWLTAHKFDFDFQPKFTIHENVKKRMTIPLLNNVETKPKALRVTADFGINVFNKFGGKVNNYYIVLELKGFHKKKTSKQKWEYNHGYTAYMLRYNILAHRLYEEGKHNHVIRIVQKEHMALLRTQLIALKHGKMNIKEFMQIKY